MTEPPKLMYATGLYRYLMYEAGVKVNPVDVSRELNDFRDAGLIVETAQHELPVSGNARVYTEAESEGWLMVNAVVETFRLWYPESVSHNSAPPSP